MSPISDKMTEQRKIQRKEVSNNDRQRIIDAYLDGSNLNSLSMIFWLVVSEMRQLY